MRRACAVVLALVTLAALAWVATPMVLIRPFGAQTPAGLALSYAMRVRGGALTLLLLLIGGAAAILLRPWRLSWKGRTAAGVAVSALAACAFLARSNYFEWMFRPLPHPEFIEIARAKDVADDDLVLGVQVAAEAHAYPVRAMAYHHVVNDVVAGEPIVATY
jgi:uncharacterized protein DUF3179